MYSLEKKKTCFGEDSLNPPFDQGFAVILTIHFFPFSPTKLVVFGQNKPYEKHSQLSKFKSAPKM